MYKAFMRCKHIIKLLPKIRASLAIKLYSLGLSQNKIAKLLEVSQAEVSNYIRFKRGEVLELKVLNYILQELLKDKSLSDILCKYCEKLIQEINTLQQ